MSTMIETPIPIRIVEADEPDRPIQMTCRDVAVSIVAPVYNEAATLLDLYHRVCRMMQQVGESWELILVNNDSCDQSAAVIDYLHKVDARVTGINLSCGCRFQAAVTAGLEMAQGDAVILVDADLQDSCEVISEMIRRWRTGYDVIYGDHGGCEREIGFKKATASLSLFCHFGQEHQTRQ